MPVGTPAVHLPHLEIYLYDYETEFTECVLTGNESKPSSRYQPLKYGQGFIALSASLGETLKLDDLKGAVIYYLNFIDKQ